MGLDIYFHHADRKFTGDVTRENVDKFLDAADQDAKERLKKRLTLLTVSLESAWSNSRENDFLTNIYNDRYFQFVEAIRPLIGCNYDLKMYPYVAGVPDYPKLEEMLRQEVEEYHEPHLAYFRKVNFLFEYFSSKMIDEYFSIVTEEDVNDIITRCNAVLNDHSRAEELLPTCSGFFFGNTDYDEHYFECVKNVGNAMVEYLKHFDGKGTGYVIFSW